MGRRIAIGTLILLTILPAVASGRSRTIRRLDGTSISPTEVDTTVTKLMKAAGVPGMNIAIFNGGRPVYMKSYGYRDTGRKLPLTPDSVMSAASFTKVAFAYMVMQLVQEGRLDLDTPVQRYLPKPLPDYPHYADLAGDARYKLITARMLLDHTSGFANWRWFEDDRKLKIHFQPGSRYAYSGEGIDLLQLVVETIMKERLEQLMQERVFRPLGMTRTSMVWQPAFESDYANGYDEYGRSLGPHKWKKADAAGSMQTTLRDFSRLVEAVMRGKGLHKKGRAEMLGPQVRIHSRHEFPTLVNETTDAYDAIRLSYGLGWGLYWTRYGKAFFKEGHDEGWRNYTLDFDKPKAGILIMTNSSNGEGIYEYLLQAVLGDTSNPTDWEGFTPYDKLPPRKPLTQHTAVTLPPAVLDLYVGRYGQPDLVLNIRREGDHLSVQENDEPKQELYPESGSDFFSTASDDVYTFQFDSQTHTVRMILHADGKDIIINRLE